MAASKLWSWAEVLPQTRSMTPSSLSSRRSIRSTSCALTLADSFSAARCCDAKNLFDSFNFFKADAWAMRILTCDFSSSSMRALNKMADVNEQHNTYTTIK